MACIMNETYITSNLTKYRAYKTHDCFNGNFLYSIGFYTYRNLFMVEVFFHNLIYMYFDKKIVQKCTVVDLQKLHLPFFYMSKPENINAHKI